MPGRVINNADAQQCDQCSDDVIFIRGIMVELHGPKDRHHNEKAAISGIYSGKVGGLPGSDNSVKGKCEAAQKSVPPGLVFFEAEPDEVASTYFAKAGQYENGY